MKYILQDRDALYKNLWFVAFYAGLGYAAFKLATYLLHVAYVISIRPA